MPVRVVKRSGKRPWKLIERSGKVVGSSLTKADAEKAARARNSAYPKKHAKR